MELDDVITTPAGDGEEIATPEVSPAEVRGAAAGGTTEVVAAQEPATTPLDSIMQGLEAAAQSEAARIEEAPPEHGQEATSDASVVEEGAQPPRPTAEPTSEEKAAAALVAEYRKLPGIVSDLVRGSTIEEVTASLGAARSVYDAVKQQVLKEQSAGLPKARSGVGPAPVPATPLGMIEAGLERAQVRKH
jgi:hypothetical protein